MTHFRCISYLPDDCLFRIAGYLVETDVDDNELVARCPTKLTFVMSSEHDAVRDVLALAASGKEGLVVARMASELLDRSKDKEVESECRKVCDHIDDDDTQDIHPDAGLGLWKLKSGTTVQDLETVCVIARVPVSGTKDQLVARLRGVWKKRGLGQVHVAGLPLMTRGKARDAKRAHMGFSHFVTPKLARRAYGTEILRCLGEPSKLNQRRVRAAVINKYGSTKALCERLATMGEFPEEEDDATVNSTYLNLLPELLKIEALSKMADCNSTNGFIAFQDTGIHHPKKDVVTLASDYVRSERYAAHMQAKRTSPELATIEGLQTAVRHNDASGCHVALEENGVRPTRDVVALADHLYRSELDIVHMQARRAIYDNVVDKYVRFAARD